MVAFVLAVVLSAGGASTPTGVTPGAGAMAMSMPARGSPARIHLTLRDSDGRLHPLPGGRAGAVLFIESRGCQACVRMASSLNTLQTRFGDRIDIHALSVDASDTRNDISAFRSSANAPGLAVAIDTRLGDVAGMFEDPIFGTVLVYDRQGKVVARLASAGGAQLRTALSDALRSRAP